MIAEKGLPSLRWRSPWPHHVLRHGRLPDIDAKHEELAVDPRCTPKRIRNTYVSNELTNLQWLLRSATSCSRFPAPIRPEAMKPPTEACFYDNSLQRLRDSRRRNRNTISRAR